MSKKYGLIGFKLGHSWSPMIHDYFYNQFNIDASYELIECEEKDLKDVIELLKTGKYYGFNVTIPYKVSIMKYLDEVSKEALKIGSVNTIALIDGKTVGFNTDYYGFINELNYYNINVKSKNVYILGTGGASKSIKQALLDLGANPITVSRKPEKDNISYLELEQRDIDVLVNTTPVGMYPNISESPVNLNICKNSKIVIDIIFNPLKTKLLLDSKSEFNGLYMLVSQAIESEKIWHSLDLDLDISKIVEYVIEKKGL